MRLALNRSCRGRDPRSSGLVRAALVAIVLAGALLGAPARGTAQTPYGDAELIDGFMLTVFGAEDGNTLRDLEAASVVKKFTGPVGYTIVNGASSNYAASVRAFLADLSDAVEGLTIAQALSPETAQMVIYLIDRRDYIPTIRAKVWPGIDTAFLEINACSAVIAARRTGIEQAFVFLVADEGFTPLAHCMVEEISQSLGPANDSDDLPDSIFNDSSDVNVFGVFDWYILNMLYDPRVQAGMRIDEVAAILPAVIADVRQRLPEIMARRPAVTHHVAFTDP
ncbi:DUF2927 domain-containing protein [Acuticoccus sp. I52.16.1]|uniref:DUF2927 domain-containing protein n=1 Tax=Acuticoccus sp. I52.16.1 TaxID=2928472 RepID=UPI001FD02BCA|nr:DUF2927 domain-containing protein [Acuticoccus sp. I52.16.1]UOM35825.1 DUF2927 domain-containing protein [Acuticoccus sp. I52.16.1]